MISEHRRDTAIVGWLCVTTGLIGGLVLIGWAASIPLLRSLLPDAVQMKANTALGLVLSALALHLTSNARTDSQRRIGRAFAALVTALGLAVLSEYGFDLNLGIDELLFHDNQLLFTARPGRMSPYSALAFSMIGGALVALPSPRLRGIAWLLGGVAAAIGAVSVIGYIWNAAELTTDQLLPPVAIHAGLGYLLIGAGILIVCHRAPLLTASDISDTSIELKAASGFIGSFLLLLIGGGVTYRTSADFVESEKWVAHTQEIRTSLSQFNAALLEAESAIRGYLLTRDSSRRTEYESAIADGYKHLNEIERLVRDNPTQAQQLPVLRNTYAAYLAGLERQSFDREANSPLPAPEFLPPPDDLRLTAIRRQIQEMDNVERALLTRRQAQAFGARKNALFFLLLTLGCAASAFAFLLHSIRKEMLARRATEARIREINNHLERRVEERTAALEENQQRFVDLFEYSADALVMGDQNRIIIRVNREAEQLYGWGREELVGKPVETLLAPELADSAASMRARLEAFGNVLSNGSLRVKSTGCRRNGERFPADITLTPLRSGGAMVVVASIRDTTESEKAAEAVQRAHSELEARVEARTRELQLARQAAEDASRAKSAFLATMSHEIRTPMNGVVGMLEVLAHSAMTETQADAVRTIRTSAFNLLSIIDDVLDFSKIEAGRLELERAPVALPDLAESVCNTLVPMAAEKHVDLSLYIAPTVPDYIWSDATRLRQLFYNLTGNAIKFSGGRTGLRGRVAVRLEGGSAAEQNLLTIHVTDNGIGMSADTQAQLFTSFTQAEVSTTRRFGGTGLGLAICKHLVELMHGEVSVHSQLGRGSTFTIHLPVQAVADRAPEPRPNLANVDCILLDGLTDPADWVAQLQAVGAHIHREPDEAAAMAHARLLIRPVIIHAQGMTIEGISNWSGEHDIRHIIIGNPQSPPPSDRNIVIHDPHCLRRNERIRNVALAAGIVSPPVIVEKVTEREESKGAPTIADARANGQLILIAEDDEINQKVILRQIGALGYAADVANNGAEALRLYRAGGYSLLLTDLHMPSMDGYALTEAIRQDEAMLGAAATRIPILALTANALRGEALRAQAVGMDAYLTKPLQLEALRGALNKWLPRAAKATNPLPAPADERAAVDLTVLRSLIGDDDEAVDQVLHEYLSMLPQISADLEAAQGNGDLRRIGAITHKLKSASRSVGAMALGDLCAEIENACRIGARSEATALLENLRDSMDAARRALETHLIPPDSAESASSAMQ